MTSQEAGRNVILINAAVLSLPRETITLDEAATVFVAGRSVVQMTLAELALPDAHMVLTDFSQSASLSALNATLQAAGGLDRLILAADGEESEAVFSLMCAVLTFRPALRRRRGGRLAAVRGELVRKGRCSAPFLLPSKTYHYQSSSSGVC